MSDLLDILVVEDEAVTRSLLSHILIAQGFCVRSAEDGFAALRMIRSCVPDMLLSDLNMPGMSGFELLSVVRKLFPQIHVIATSGAYSGSDVPKGIAADSFHEKASGMEHLFELIGKRMRCSHATFCSERMPTPQWVSLEYRMPFESNHVLIHCPECLRAFRQAIEDVNTDIRETSCRYCGGQVAYAVALAIKPATPRMTTPTEVSAPSHTASTGSLQSSP